MSRFILKNPPHFEGLDYHRSYADIKEGHEHVRLMQQAGIGAHYGVNESGLHIYTEA